MDGAPPTSPQLGVLDGLAYALFLPDGEPRAGIVILHGAGSAKQNHFDFARLCRARGLAALAYDARGHGRSLGAFGPAALDDVAAMSELMRRHAPLVALRGSSMGGFQAIHAAARDPSLAAVVAVCPAPEDVLLRRLRSDERRDFRADLPACERLLERLDLFEAVARLGSRTALLLLHARGDEEIPFDVSRRLHAAAHEPKRLVLVPGGDHRSLQHDPRLQALSARFVERAAGAASQRDPGKSP